jgi:predicted Ser/Thr protein kinase
MKKVGLAHTRGKNSQVQTVRKIQNIFESEQTSRIGQGKDGIAFEYTTPNGKSTVIKQFKQSKPDKRIKLEVEFQQAASDVGISPKIIRYDPTMKCVEMEKLDNTLYTLLKLSDGKLSVRYQKRIIDIFRILDRIGIFHADPSTINFMEKDGILYIIDFGFAKKITHQLASKHNCSMTMNMEYMPMGIYIKLKELCPGREYSVIKNAIPKSKRVML